MFYIEISVFPVLRHIHKQSDHFFVTLNRLGRHGLTLAAIIAAENPTRCELLTDGRTDKRT